MLVAVTGKGSCEGVLLSAFSHTPACIIDCANKADPHRYLPLVGDAALARTHVVSIDLLYSLPDALRKVFSQMNVFGWRVVVLTFPGRLFHYQDAAENEQVFVQSWELLQKLSGRVTVFVSIRSDGVQARLAQRFATKLQGVKDMGHTVASQREVIERLFSEVRRYREVLSPEDRVVFDELLERPFLRLGAITHASSLHAWATFVLSACLEQEKGLRALEREVMKLKERKEKK